MTSIGNESFRSHRLYALTAFSFSSQNEHRQTRISIGYVITAANINELLDDSSISYGSDRLKNVSIVKKDNTNFVEVLLL